MPRSTVTYDVFLGPTDSHLPVAAFKGMCLCLLACVWRIGPHSDCIHVLDMFNMSPIYTGSLLGCHGGQPEGPRTQNKTPSGI